MDQYQTYYANGKLLITGEYMVMHGAEALAIPLSKGQSLTVGIQDKYFLQWTAIHPGGKWFTAKFDNRLQIMECSDETLALRLQNILKRIIDLNPHSYDLMKNRQVITRLEFLPEWGWGSSSTLIACLAQWLKLNPYYLLDQTFGGSGYDIACAISQGPLIYTRQDGDPHITPVSFNPPFHKDLHFVYRGKKQNSGEEIQRLKDLSIGEGDLKRMNELTNDMCHTESAHTFGRLMETHEELVGGIIGRTPVKKELYNDFKGHIKSLGAWGGDYIMVISSFGEEYIKQYFLDRGLDTLFKFDEIAITK